LFFCKIFTLGFSPSNLSNISLPCLISYELVLYLSFVSYIKLDFCVYLYLVLSYVLTACPVYLYHVIGAKRLSCISFLSDIPLACLELCPTNQSVISLPCPISYFPVWYLSTLPYVLLAFCVSLYHVLYPSSLCPIGLLYIPLSCLIFYKFFLYPSIVLCLLPALYLSYA
jgi:hypothetical protein